MMENLSIATLEELPEDFDIIEISSENTTTLRAFYETLAEVLAFPDYFGFNLDSFDELINDLSWIENQKLLIYFTNTEHFLLKERNQNKILTLLDLLEASCEEWKWVDEEEPLIPVKELLIRFSPSERIEKLIEELNS